MFNKKLICSAFAALTLAACGNATYYAHEVAQRLANPAWMIERAIPAGPFALTAFERMHQRHAPATLYIEGDGPIRHDSTPFAEDATPFNPVALHLATRDRAQNVAYLARPCQYTGLLNKEQDCSAVYGPSQRFSPIVVGAYDTALDDIKRRYNIDGFHLVGYGGGAAVAAVLAAQRGDILSLRTVAGTLDIDAVAAIDKLPLTRESLNPTAFAGALSRMPQVHFIGGQDRHTPPAVLHSYLQALGESNCVQYELIQEAGHDESWVDKWPDLLKHVPACRGPVQTLEALPPYEPEPVYRITPEVPKK